MSHPPRMLAHHHFYMILSITRSHDSELHDFSSPRVHKKWPQKWRQLSVRDLNCWILFHLESRWWRTLPWMSWFIMAPKRNPPNLGVARHLFSLRCICFVVPIVLLDCIFVWIYIYIYLLYLYTCWRRVSIETFERSWCLNFRICLSVCFASASFHVLKFGYVPLDVFIRHLLCIVLFFAVKKKQRETATFLATFFSLCHQLRIGLFKRRGCSCCFRCPGSTSHQIPCEL